MICKRCNSKCPQRDSGYCLHCQIATDLEAKLGKPLAEAGIREGFPDWEPPTKSDHIKKKGVQR